MARAISRNPGKTGAKYDFDDDSDEIFDDDKNYDDDFCNDDNHDYDYGDDNHVKYSKRMTKYGFSYTEYGLLNIHGDDDNDNHDNDDNDDGDNVQDDNLNDNGNY